ncbi:uncharacterized protein LOC111309562 [Durio zibethinus]|uniref:Uncharacterized protein LOC111309562 n=1 Tax=Durio zibethinus TaxID=66656 RepID=A0A6P6AHP5_DURZI|nr:uncharacterized protein LOC111309562 [Durio zibethinus]
MADRNCRNEHSFKISYLMNSLGFTPQSALSVSKKIHFETFQQPDTDFTHCVDNPVFLEYKNFSEILSRNFLSIAAPNLAVLKEYRANFLVALQALLQISKSAWERKFNVFKQWGWSDEDIVSAFEKYPRFMMFSEHKVTALMNFFINTMGLKSSYIANRLVFLSYRLERRIIPRCSVLRALLSKGLIEKFSVNLMLMYTENEFLQRFVNPYGDPFLLKFI